MMNWRAIPRPELCFPEADSFGAIWFGVFSLLNKSDPRNHTKFRRPKLVPFVYFVDYLPGSAGSLPARTPKLRVPTFQQKDTTDLIQSIMRIRLHSSRSSSDKPLVNNQVMSLFPRRAPKIEEYRDSGSCRLDLMPIIVGAPRSGTTLLRLMLDSHPALAIRSETAFLKLGTELKGRDHKLRERFVRALVT
jgi:hypothetical protein